MIRVKQVVCLIASVTILNTVQGGAVSSAYSTIDFPHDQAYINTNQPTIIGTLRDEMGMPIANETVQIFINNTLIGSAISDQNGIYRLLVNPGLTDGQYELSIFCVESQATVESNTFNIDTTFPSASITYPAQGDAITNSTIIVVGTTEALAMVVTFLDADTFGNICYADAYGNWSIEYDGLNNGAHTITAQATDIAGNQGEISEGIHFSVTA